MAVSFQLASKELVFFGPFGKYEEGVTVVFYNGPRGVHHKQRLEKMADTAFGANKIGGESA